MLNRILFIGVMLFCSFLLLGQPSSDAQHAAIPKDSRELNVIVSIPPLEYLVKNIGGKCVEVHSFLPQGRSPETFDVRPADISRALKADLYIAAGFLFEERIEGLGSVRMYHTLADLGIPLAYEPADLHLEETGNKEEHEDEHGHEHENDPHVWLSPALFLRLIPSIQEELTQLQPECGQYFADNAKLTAKKISDIAEEIKVLLASLSTRDFLTYHNAFDYFADYFGLTVQAIERDGKEPSMKWLAEMQSLIEEKNIKVILAQPQFSIKSVELLAEWSGIGYEIVDILTPDWEGIMLSITRALINND